MQPTRQLAPLPPGRAGTSGTFSPQPLSISIDERGLGEIDSEDRTRRHAAGCMKAAREAAQAGEKQVREIHADTGTLVGDRHRAANQAACKAYALAEPHLDKAKGSLEKIISEIRLKIDRGPEPGDTSQHLLPEVRQRLAGMPQSDRFLHLRKSIEAGADDVLISAALSAPPMLSGLTDGEAELLRGLWSKSHLPEQCARVAQLQKDLAIVQQSSRLLTHWRNGAASEEWLRPAPVGGAPLSRNPTLEERATMADAAMARINGGTTL